MTKIALAVVALLAIGCGDISYPPAAAPSVIPPAPALNITGRWDGTLTATLDGERHVSSLMLRVDHTGDRVTGTWRLLTGGTLGSQFVVVGTEWGGELSASLRDGALTGAGTWEMPTSAGLCRGTFTFSGAAAPERITADSPSVALSGCATTITGLRLTVLPTYGTAG